MSKLIPIVLVALIAYSLFRGNSGGKVDFPMRVISQPTPVKTVPQDQRVRVVLFTGTEWCGACQQLDQSVISTPAWKEFAAKEIQFRAFDFAADRGKVPAAYQKMAQQYNVRGFPTMLVIDENNEVLSRQVGCGPPVENWKAWIRGHASL